MVAVSIAITRGKDGFRIDDFTIGAAAPTGGTDVEIRYQLLDQLGNNMTRKDIFIFVEAIERLIMEQGLQLPAGTFLLPGLGV